MVTIKYLKYRAARPPSAQVRNVVLREQAVQDHVFEKCLGAKVKQRLLPRGPAFHKAQVTPQDSPECLWLFRVLGGLRIPSLLCGRCKGRIKGICLGR